MEESIMNFLEEKKQYTKGMTDTEIYNYICDVFYMYFVNDYITARRCSIKHWKKINNISD